MKRAAWYVIAGTVAGFAGALGLHGRAAPPSVVAQPRPAPAVPPPHPPRPPRRQAENRCPACWARAAGHRGGWSSTATASCQLPSPCAGTRSPTSTVPVLRTAEPYSQQLATQVLPTLKSEVLAAHSARINAVSGATYTSQAYADSIQSALDKLHIR